MSDLNCTEDFFFTSKIKPKESVLASKDMKVLIFSSTFLQVPIRLSR